MRDADLPPVPDWIAERFVQQDPPVPTAGSVELVPFRGDVSAWARAALENECRNVVEAPQGSRNDTLNRAAFALAQIVAAGALSEAHVRGALEEVAIASGLRIGEARKTVSSGFRAGLTKPRDLPDTARSFDGPPITIGNTPKLVETANGALADAQTGQALTFAPKAPDPLKALTHCPGLVGDLVDFITETARRPNRVLALGAAVTIVGTLIGRRVATPTRSGTHLYVVTLAPTGAGKQHALNCITRLMKSAKANHHIGPSQFMSMSAVLNFIQRTALSLCPQDEFGAFLKRLSNKRASSHEQGISMVLRSMWGASFETMTTPEWAGRKAEAISAPAMSICGYSTADEFFGALQGEDIVNGFLNRFLIVQSGEKVTDRDPDLPVGDVPERLAEALQHIYNWDGTQLGTARLNDPDLDPTPELIHWAGKSAQDCYRDIAHRLEEIAHADASAEPFVARAQEIALRLASIRAAGRWARGAAVDQSDMEWGRDVALASAGLLVTEARANMAENERQRWSNRVANFVRARPVVKIRDIQMQLRGALKSAELKDILLTLMAEGRIERSDIKGLTGTFEAYRYLGP